MPYTSMPTPTYSGMSTDSRESTTGEVANYFGLPRDLDGDGDRFDRDVSDRYQILLFRVTVGWMSTRGPRKILVYGSRSDEVEEGSPPSSSR